MEIGKVYPESESEKGVCLREWVISRFMRFPRGDIQRTQDREGHETGRLRSTKQETPESRDGEVG